MCYIRIIDWEKWNNKQPLDVSSICDIIAEDGEASVWMDDESQDRLLDLLLAYSLTLGKARDLYYVKIPDEIANAKGLMFRPEDSVTPFVEMRSLHTNVKTPTLYELGYLAEAIYESINVGNCDYITEVEISDRYFEMLKADKLEINLSEKKYGKWKALYQTIAHEKGKIDFSRHKKSFLEVKAEATSTGNS